MRHLYTRLRILTCIAYTFIFHTSCNEQSLTDLEARSPRSSQNAIRDARQTLLPYVANMQMLRDSGLFACSATLISPTIALTAAHCTKRAASIDLTFSNKREIGTIHATAWVNFGHAFFEPLGGRTESTLDTFPSTANPAGDLSIVLLDSPVKGIDTFPTLDPNTPQVGDNIITYGRMNNGFSDYFFKSPPAPIFSIQDHFLWTLPGYGEKGDSGGMVTTNDEDNIAILGVFSCMAGFYPYVPENPYEQCSARITPFYDLITRHMSLPVCGLSSQLLTFGPKNDTLADFVLPLDYDGDGDDDLFSYTARMRHGASALYAATESLRFEKVSSDCLFNLWGMNDPDNRAAALDSNGDGKDDLLLYRSAIGKSKIWLLESLGDGQFKAIQTGSALGGHDLSAGGELAVPLDYDGDKRDDILFYRPGAGTFSLLHNDDRGKFSATEYTDGIAGCDLLSPADHIIALDFNRDGRDDVLIYRPGLGYLWIAKSTGNGQFEAVYVVDNPSRESSSGFLGSQGSNIGRNLLNPEGRLIAARLSGDGFRDDLIYVEPATGIVQYLESTGDGLYDSVGYTINRLNALDMRISSDSLSAADFSGDKRDEIFNLNTSTGLVHLISAGPSCP